VQILDKQVPTAWFLGIPLSYFIVSFLENFYQTPLQIAMWTIVIHSLSNLLMYYLLQRALREFRTEGWHAAGAAILFSALTVFVFAGYALAKPFTELFDAAAFHLDAALRVPFLNALIPSFFIAAVVVNVARQRNWAETSWWRMLSAKLDGLLLSFLFFSAYLIFASIFNRPTYDADDIFFDADANLYRWRYATEAYRDYYWRPAHPFILIIIRPMVGLLAFLFRGDTLFAAFTLNALIGALCVFLVWYFVRHSVGNRFYALLMAALFGASSTQLVFGALIESYIYLSAVALIFLVLLLKDAPLWAQVLTGLAAFGITISNVGQTFITHFFVKRNLKQIIVYGVIIVALVVPLSLLNNWVYPNAHPYFWDFSSLEGEGKNSFAPTLQRTEYLVRVMALHSFVAPEPLLIFDGWPFPKTWMFRASIKKEPMQIAEYESALGNGLAFAWMGLLLLGAVFFFKNIRKQDNGYFIAFIVTLLFYFALHLNYGKDVFLYATNWTYIVILFLALAWRELAERRWFQILLLVFALLVLTNNADLYLTMMQNTAPYVTFPIWR
jgi:hypothetical protein